MIEALKKKLEKRRASGRAFTYEILDNGVFGTIKAADPFSARKEIEKVLGRRERSLIIREI